MVAQNTAPNFLDSKKQGTAILQLCDLGKLHCAKVSSFVKWDNNITS